MNLNRQGREHVFISNCHVGIWQKCPVWEANANVLRSRRKHLQRAPYCLCSLPESHSSPTSCLFPYSTAFELTPHSPAHLFLACCWVSVGRISRLACASGKAAVLLGLPLPSPFFTPLCRELVLQDRVASLTKLFLETCFFQTPTRYFRRKAFASPSSLFI